MKKTILFVLSFIALVVVASSCDKNETLQEKIEEEKKAIQRFIDKNDFIILSAYPQDGVFKEKEYYKTSSGLYINVIDSGNGKRATPLKDEIQVRFEGMLYFKSETKEVDSDQLSPFGPMSFIYGNTYSYGTYGCKGWEEPLGYVGEEAVVSLIVPSNVGNYADKNTNIVPVFYKQLKYTRFY